MNPQSPEESDGAIARAVASGDIECFETLVLRHQHALLRFLESCVGCREEAEDVAQLAFVRAFRQIARFDPSRSFRTWLFTIARRLAISRYRAGESAPVQLVQSEACVRSASEDLEERETAEALWRWVGEHLPRKQYVAFWLRYHEEMSVREIASITGLTSIHIKVLLHRARRTLADTWPPRSEPLASKPCISPNH